MAKKAGRGTTKNIFFKNQEMIQLTVLKKQELYLSVQWR
jgi:hypothetical protein